MNHHLLLIIHLLGAAVWVGGHLILAIGILPKALRTKDQHMILRFEKQYEPVGMTALVFMVITGIWMALQFGVGPGQWLSFSSPIERVISLKLTSLLLTVCFAVSAQTRVIPKLKHSPAKLPEMAFHMITVTVLGVIMLILGSFVRYGGL